MSAGHTLGGQLWSLPLLPHQTRFVKWVWSLLSSLAPLLLLQGSRVIPKGIWWFLMIAAERLVCRPIETRMFGSCTISLSTLATSFLMFSSVRMPVMMSRPGSCSITSWSFPCSSRARFPSSVPGRGTSVLSLSVPGLPVGSSTSGKVFSCIQPGLAWRRHGFWHCNQTQVLVLLFRKAFLLLILCSLVQSLLLIVGFFVNSVSVGLLLRPTIVGAAFLFFLLYLRFRGHSRHRGFGRWGPSLRRWVSTLGTARASRRRGRADARTRPAPAIPSLRKARTWRTVLTMASWARARVPASPHAARSSPTKASHPVQAMHQESPKCGSVWWHLLHLTDITWA